MDGRCQDTETNSEFGRGKMPAVKADDLSALPRIASIDAEAANERRVVTVVDAPRMLEGAGFEVRRAFAKLDMQLVDPFILLDHMGAVEYSPGEAKGAPDHPHRGFETGALYCTCSSCLFR